MNRLHRLLFLATVMVGSSTVSWATETVPLEFRQPPTTFNFQSQRGVPISGTVNTNIGSDGRLPAVNESGSANPATTNQFRGFMGFGAIVAPTNRPAISNSTILKNGTTAFSPSVVTAMQLPVAKTNNNIIMVLRRAQVGAPFLSRQVSFLFGSVIPVPSTDENGLLLTNILKEQYWFAEPHSTNDHTNATYYWSPHAEKVYAVQSGQINITWKKVASTTTVPSDYTTNSANYSLEGGNYFRLYKTTYVVSGSPVKTPRKMYWTEKTFQNVGKIVTIPVARIGDVNIVYNNSFPRTVAKEYFAPGQYIPTEGTTNNTLAELHTLWYDQQFGALHAYNTEGRVFVELLGDNRDGGLARYQLGFEIVDVYKQVNPQDVTIELGERVTPPVGGSIETLSPSPIVQVGGGEFAYSRTLSGSGQTELYATDETQNINDYMVHWMEAGVENIRWPSLFARYHFVWPSDPSAYSHYVRPVATNEFEASLTAVTLPTGNLPVIEYQDPFDKVRAKLTADYKFYTFLDTTVPAHRTLLRFSSGENIAFERVFSWLDVNLKTTNFANTVVTNLSVWNPTNNTFNWSNPYILPRIVNDTVNVGQRVAAPFNEIGGSFLSPNYLAGHIRQSAGDSFNPRAYVDPLANNFASANLSAIIPVNAIPGSNKLEVWWFRANTPNLQQGFKTVYWPAVIGRYTIQWPTSPEIVLASNKGDGGTNPLVSLGTIYAQNNPNLPGYNPNEEHAIMSGGTAFALRDDLNITNAAGFSSLPYVLVDYTGADGRPAMAAYKVLREKPSEGILFDYVVKAGTLLQPPMPLPLMAGPVEGSGDSAINYNSESSQAGGDLPGAWNDTRDADGTFGHYKKFTYRDRKQGFWVYRGLHSGLPALKVGAYNQTTGSFTNLPSATAVAGQTFRYYVHASQESQYLNLSSTNLTATNLSWLSIDGLSLTGVPTTNNLGTNTLQLVTANRVDGSRVTNSLTIQVVSNGLPVMQASLHVLSTNNYTGVVVDFTNRPPFLAQSPVSSNSFTMRFYYKTEAGFDWPGVANPPAVGSIVPYLRPFNAASNIFVGDGTSKTTPSLDIVYRPVWPMLDPKDERKEVPTLPYGQTLTEPVNGMPGVRDFKTANILYQQSIAANITNAVVSAVLHDATREKVSGLAAQGLTAVPSGVQTDYYQGKYYFPQLPPHLASRFYFDPNRGTNGSVVLKGEFKDELVGEKYILLNVLRDTDLAAVKALCPAGDANYTKWTSLIDALATTVETFYENPAALGTYIANPALSVNVGVGDLAVVTNNNTAVDSYALSATGPGSGYITLIEANGTAFTQSGDPVSMHILKVGGSLYNGELKVIPAPNPLSEQVTFQHTADLAGRSAEYEYQWKIGSPVDGLPPVTDATMSRYLSLTNGLGAMRYTLGGAGIQALSDNYVVMRYRPISTNHPLYKAVPTDSDWSGWTSPQLAEGWIKRALAGINPFNQRTSDLFNNLVNTDVSIVSQAGHRWEGDIALNADTLDSHGLIEIYETILRRGRSLSIEVGYNYGPANDALLLAAGYLNDLYMMLGNEAWADAANPTIGLGTQNQTYGDISTALFQFKGQVPSLLEEELALLRGRDDFLLPGVQTPPFYNRLVWNYTRGIDSGEVIYALNNNILDENNDGVVNAADAAKLFPQGHGDAYGHYLTALKGYYSLLLNPNFDWVPRIEAVTVLGQPVSVDYQDERKFAAAAVAVGRAGRQIFDLTWRKDFQADHTLGWDYMSATRVNPSRQFGDTTSTNNSVRYWGLDHWAARTGQGAYLNWVIGNAILPAVDPNPAHEGIQKVDRTTVPELQELPQIEEELQTAMDNAEGGLTPLGLPAGAIAFDVNPNTVVGTDSGTHFEQIYERTKIALKNAVAAFDDAKDVTRLMRSEQDSLADFRANVAKQELAFNNALIELYGSPYPDDMGAGKTYNQDYSGPDLVHYAYVNRPESTFGDLLTPQESTTFKVDIQQLPADWITTMYTNFDFNVPASATAYGQGTHYISFTIGPDGFAEKPATWTGKRASPGKIQQAASRLISARTKLRQELGDAEGAKQDLDKAAIAFTTRMNTASNIIAFGNESADLEQSINESQAAFDKTAANYDSALAGLDLAQDIATTGTPDTLIAGLATGGNFGKIGIGLLVGGIGGGKIALNTAKALQFSSTSDTIRGDQQQMVALAKKIAAYQFEQDLKDGILDLVAQLGEVQGHLVNINECLRSVDDAERAYDAVVAEGDRIQQERLAFRQRASAVIQGFRTRDAAFRVFRNEKLERYKTLFDLSARYAFLSANAYDYETGLLNTSEGRSFIARIVNSRALGVVRNGEPQYAGSDTGDPGLSSVLAEMKADWDVLRGRLGFNNPDAYGTTASLRTENYRILPGTNGLIAWQDLLQHSKRDDVMADEDVRRYCMQIAPVSGTAVPGFIFEFSTTIANGLNIFGRELAAGDHAFSSSSFATKIFGVGVALEGYRGMDNPSANSGVTSSGGTSPSDPNSSYLDPLALSATPYIYLIPVGLDAMRSPPLGDTADIRTWTVDDVSIPLPFNIGASDFSTKSLYTSSDSLTEPLFSVRKHQSFRPVSSASYFSTSLYGPTGTLQRTQYTNNRLVARSVWNTKWKVVIPGYTLLNDPKQGMDRFIQTVTDMKVHFVTYSYSGN